MATSSIFADFRIRDKKTAEAFINALDESANSAPYVPEYQPAHLVTDSKELDRIFTHMESRKAENK